MVTPYLWDRKGLGPITGERLASPSRTVVSCWNPCLSRGCGQLRHLPGECRSPKAAGCGWNAVHGDGRRSAGLWPPPGGPGSLAGGGRLAAARCGWSAQWVTGARLAAGEPDRVQVCRGEAWLARRRRPLQGWAWWLQQREPGALFLEQRQALRGRGHEHGGDRGHPKVRGDTAGGRRGDLGGGDWRGGPSPEHPPPDLRRSRPRSPRLPPIQTPASSRPGSPGNR